MRPTGSLRLAALCLSVLCTGCILYTDPVNEAPRIVELTSMPAQRSVLNRRSPVILQASVSDDQKGPLSMTWWVVPGACREPFPSDARALTNNQYVPSKVGPHCFRVEVVDGHGASATATGQFEVINATPTAQIALKVPEKQTTTYPLFSDFVLEPRLTDPDSGEVPQHRWTLSGPDGQAHAVTPCPNTPKSLCFHTERAGTYRVTLGATDLDGGEAPEDTLVLNINEDMPPCIVEPQPAIFDVVRDPNTALTLSFAVADDGDPLPARATRPSLGSITWRFRRAGSGALERIVGASERFLTMPAGAFVPGDDIELRVDISDRIDRKLSATCTDEAATCALSPTCLQRMSWRLRYL